jgi:hypothetical protein
MLLAYTNTRIKVALRAQKDSNAFWETTEINVGLCPSVPDLITHIDIKGTHLTPAVINRLSSDSVGMLIHCTSHHFLTLKFSVTEDTNMAMSELLNTAEHQRQYGSDLKVSNVYQIKRNMQILM